jgi:hypothetical protein
MKNRQLTHHWRIFFPKLGSRGILRHRRMKAPGRERQRRGKEQEKNFLPGGSAQLLEKARFGQANPRKSKLFPLIVFARIWPGLAGFG